MQDRPYFTFVPAGPRTTTALHRIVIVGGGAGGLELAVRLGEKLKHKRKAEIVLIDPLLTHVWKPLLHEVAAGTLLTADAGLDFLQQAKRHHFRFHLGAMASLDRKRKEIGLSPLHDELGNEIAPQRSLWYDTLVIAIGSRDNDFGIPGVKEHCVPLNGPDDAQHFHRRLLALFARAEMLNRGPVRVVIVGGGATGVELAAELLDSTRIIASYGAHLQQYPSAIRICLVDSAARLLSALPEHLGQQSARDLAERGVEIRLQQKVIGIDPHRVILSDGKKQHIVSSDITVWAAGIRCPDMLAGIDGLESNRLN
ncbi:MAG TPA: FAD-dependent oxidoreductase [Azonexus sp.]|nr:FAD-dependent oxidoreductase [Azonexus sp.]